MTFPATALPLNGVLNSTSVSSSIEGTNVLAINGTEQTGKQAVFSLLSGINAQFLLSQANKEAQPNQLALTNTAQLTHDVPVEGQYGAEISGGLLMQVVQKLPAQLNDHGKDLPQLLVAMRNIAAGLPLDEDFADLPIVSTTETAEQLDIDIAVSSEASLVAVVESNNKLAAFIEEEAIVGAGSVDEALTGEYTKNAQIVPPSDFFTHQQASGKLHELANDSTNKIAQNESIITNHVKTKLENLPGHSHLETAHSSSLSTLKSAKPLSQQVLTEPTSRPLVQLASAVLPVIDQQVKPASLSGDTALQKRIDELSEAMLSLPRERSEFRASRSADINKAAETQFNTRIELPVQHANWGRQIAQKIGWLANNGIRVAQLQLNPAELGPLQVRIDSQQEQTVVIFSSHVASVRETLDAQIPRMRELFAEQGLELGDVDIHESPLQQEQQGDRKTYEEAEDLLAAKTHQNDEQSGPAELVVEEGQEILLERIDYYV